MNENIKECRLLSKASFCTDNSDRRVLHIYLVQHDVCLQFGPQFFCIPKSNSNMLWRNRNTSIFLYTMVKSCNTCLMEMSDHVRVCLHSSTYYNLLCYSIIFKWYLNVYLLTLEWCTMEIKVNYMLQFHEIKEIGTISFTTDEERKALKII